MAAEAFEARLVREPIHEQPQEIFDGLPRTRRADINPLPAAALLAGHIDEHAGAKSNTEHISELVIKSGAGYVMGSPP